MPRDEKDELASSGSDLPAAGTEAVRVIREVTDELLLESVEVLLGASKFTEIDPEDPKPPAEWVRRFGASKALKLHRCAKYAMLPGSQAPVGFKIVSQVFAGIMKTRERHNDRGLDFGGGVTVECPVEAFPEMEVDDD